MATEKKGKEELEVFTKAKKLCDYTFQITCKAPKAYRWNIIDKILNNTLELIEILYQANDLSDKERKVKQRYADTKIKILGYLHGLANNIHVFDNKQTEHLGLLLLETRQGLFKWIKGEEKGLNSS